MESVISESELAEFRFNHESTWKKCVKLIREGKLRVVEDAKPYKILKENTGNTTPGDPCIS